MLHPLTFRSPMPITQLQDLESCTLLVIPKTQVGSPYYNPLFMPKEALKPVVLVDDDFPYVASLALGVFPVYTKPKLMNKVYCGEEQVVTQELEGLSWITLRRDCRLVHDDFVSEPTIDFGGQDNQLSEILLTFDNDLNMSQVLEWGLANGLLCQSDQGNGLTMLEVAGRWSYDKLDEIIRWTFQTIMVVVGASILGMVVCCCYA